MKDILYLKVFVPGGRRYFRFENGMPKEIKQDEIEGEKGLIARFYAPNSISGRRYKGLFLKEPETIDWLRQLSKEDVLWDVGANVGIYTIYAALVVQCKVVAIEPGSYNYFTLCKNIELNGLSNLVSAFCVGLGDKFKASDLWMATTEAGGAINAVDVPTDDRGKPFRPAFRQGVISIPADILVNQLKVPQPTAIKIDVDGYEIHVLKGCPLVLRNPKLKRISIEVDSTNTDTVETITGMLEMVGFRKIGEFRSAYAATSPIHNLHFERT